MESSQLYKIKNLGHLINVANSTHDTNWTAITSSGTIAVDAEFTSTTPTPFTAAANIAFPTFTCGDADLTANLGRACVIDGLGSLIASEWADLGYVGGGIPPLGAHLQLPVSLPTLVNKNATLRSFQFLLDMEAGWSATIVDNGGINWQNWGAADNNVGTSFTVAKKTYTEIVAGSLISDGFVAELSINASGQVSPVGLPFAKVIQNDNGVAWMCIQPNENSVYSGIDLTFASDDVATLPVGQMYFIRTLDFASGPAPQTMAITYKNSTTGANVVVGNIGPNQVKILKVVSDIANPFVMY